MDLRDFFFQTYWSTVKEVVLNCVWDFFRGHHLLREQNHTFIALNPKRLGPFMVNHFRPISLCNLVYKLISKILANRLKGILHLFISPQQSTFVPSRTIQDSSILAQELLHTLKSKQGRGGLMAVKVDMEKAFDRMERDFLLSILGKLVFILPGFRGFTFVYLPPPFLSSLMALHLGCFPPPGVFGKGTLYPLSFSSSVQKFFLV
jgi:hypothetical protein